ncbi:unnamed protein product [Zymoseptoria tritici ST99CH_3D7]|uniref:Zn(2)-C6 fungal-type domain-containing protein n=1 Tax=Zymoseptoria tritici (strain ST99CH_3D7) TaxID=1276538 RepID=A0A1X7RGN1_ZYMT9|nr:unnamed protein product [Zymoseptoria tritici ST99CH_3D7]
MLAGSTTVVVDRPRAGSNTSGTSDDSNQSTSTSPTSDATGSIGNSNKQLARIERRPGQQRRYAPKTRTGCITCKIRRVKCDEGKPYCKRCTTTGRKCDGYTNLVEQKQQPKGTESLSMALVSGVSADAFERRTFDFFRAKTAPTVSGYFQDSVWDRIVLQLSHSEPAVRHAVNALGSLHEHLSDVGNGNVNDSLVKASYPTQQYAKTLGAMQALMQGGNASMDVVLVCALICIHFEALREAFVPCLMHVENAIQLLNSKNGTLDARKVNPSLVRAIMRMDLQGTMYLGSRIPGLSFFSAADDILPSSFHDLTQARDLVNTWSSRLYHFMRTIADHHRFQSVGDIALEHIAKAQELEATFLDFDRLLWEYMHKPSAKFSTREQLGLGMLRSRVKMNRILSSTCLYAEACRFDLFLSDFEDILTICSYIMSSDNADKRFFAVSLDEGLVQPLFFIATHCRDGRLRHQALAHLGKLPSKEGIRHVTTSLRTAEVCVAFEEADCGKQIATCEDIPEWKRIHSASFGGSNLHLPENKVLMHLNLRPNGLDGEWAVFVEELDWAASGDTFTENFMLLGPQLQQF